MAKRRRRPNAGTMQRAAALEKYEHFGKSRFPTFAQYESWAVPDLMIKGLQLSGPNPTSSGGNQGPTRHEGL